MRHLPTKKLQVVCIGFLFIVSIWTIPHTLSAQAIRHIEVDDSINVEILHLAREKMAEEKWDEAIKQLSSILRREPENLEARYSRGIARREKEKAYSLLTTSLGDLNYIIEHDSLFQDVLYQKALTLRFRGQYDSDYTDAIELAERQVQLKPYLAETRAGLMNIYRFFTRLPHSPRRIRWIRNHDSDYARYFYGEMLRREERYREAEDVFVALHEQYDADIELEVPVQSVLLSLARVQYELGNLETGQALVEEAIASVNSRFAGQLVFDDFKHIVDENELTLFGRLETPSEYRSFFQAIWERRDPMPAREVNMRLYEHYRRLDLAERIYLYNGIRAWYNRPVRSGPTMWRPGEPAFEDSDFPATYDFGSELDDRGILYIRHGEPDKKAYASPDDRIMFGPRGNEPGMVSAPDVPGNAESWLYRDPELHYHFATSDNANGVGSYRLRPTPHGKVLDNVQLWSSDYMGMKKDPSLVEDQILQVSLAYLDEGLTTDRHTWEEDVKTFSFPVMLAAFKGPDDKTQLDIYYGLPLGELTELLENTGNDLEVEVGIAFHDTLWNNLGESTEIKTLQDTSDRSSIAVDLFQVNLSPESYHVALHARSLKEDVLGGYKIDYDVPDFSGSGLNISDILPAYQVIETDLTGRYTRRGHYIRANPSGQFSRQQTVYVYYELYNLAMDDNGRTSYEMEYTLESVEKHGKMLGLVGGEKIVLSIRAEGSGREASPALYSEIDVSSVPAGHYTLRVSVTDIQTGRAVENRGEVVLI